MSQQSPNKSLEVVIDNSDTAEAAVKVLDHEIDLTDSGFYENRELSLLKFNSRVLKQAKNHHHPLLERVIFLLIFSSNLHIVISQ